MTDTNSTTACVALQRACHILVAFALMSSAPLGFAQSAMPGSEISYPGASATSPFTATEPYVLNIGGVNKTIYLGGASRTFDYSGNVPFINRNTGKSDVASIQAWDPAFASTFSPPLPETYYLDQSLMTNAGFPGRVDKRNTVDGTLTTMVRYNAGDGLTWGTARSKLNAWAVPPRTRARWDLEVAFGNPDGTNDWPLTPTTTWVQDASGNWATAPGSSPVLFWQLKSENQTNPALAAEVDTDSKDPSKLMISFFIHTGSLTKNTMIAQVHGLPRHTQIPISIEAFLDDRDASAGGKGLLQIWVDNKFVVEKVGPTLAKGTKEHWWSMDMYLYNEYQPYAHTRASFWKTAKMRVFPVGTTATAPALTPAPAPVPATSGTPTISDAQIDNVTATSATINWTTSVPTHASA